MKGNVIELIFTNFMAFSFPLSFSPSKCFAYHIRRGRATRIYPCLSSSLRVTIFRLLAFKIQSLAYLATVTRTPLHLEHAIFINPS